MNSKYTNIRVLVGRSLEAVEDSQCDDVRECDTIAEAKKFARYSLTPAYQASAEISESMNYARVMACEDGADVCVADYFRRGYVVPVSTFASLVFKTTDEEFLKQFKIIDYSPLSNEKGKTRIAAIALAKRAFYLGVRYAEDKAK